jgi:hypothetical protein
MLESAGVTAVRTSGKGVQNYALVRSQSGEKTRTPLRFGPLRQLCKYEQPGRTYTLIGACPLTTREAGGSYPLKRKSVTLVHLRLQA